MDFPVNPSDEAMYTLFDMPPSVSGSGPGREGYLTGARVAGAGRPDTMESMLRVALRPRFLGILALMLLTAVLCGALATWQWERAQRGIQEEPAASGDQTTLADAVPIGELLQPGESFPGELQHRAVTATGVFDPQRQVLVPGRSIDGEDATLILTALVVDSDAGPAALPVVRGWVTDPAHPAVTDVPSGEVTVTGWLQASEASQRGVLSDGVIGEISSPLLVNLWGGPIHTGYVAATGPAVDAATGDPVTAAAPAPMPQAESAHSRSLDWQNLGYAAQWLVFGAFFVYLWWRMVRDEFLAEQADARAAVGIADGPGADRATGAASAAHADRGAGSASAAAADPAAGSASISSSCSAPPSAPPATGTVPEGDRVR